MPSNPLRPPGRLARELCLGLAAACLSAAGLAAPTHAAERSPSLLSNDYPRCEHGKQQPSTANASAAPIRFGRINLLSTQLQPPGSLLASTVVPSSAYTENGAHAETVLWKCDAALLPSLHFLVATNGRARYGGHHDVGAADGLVHVYGTWFDHVGLRLNLGGVTLTRTWQRLAVKAYDRDTEKGRPVILIRLKHMPALHAELYRVGQTVPKGGETSGCGDTPKKAKLALKYKCDAPNAYIQLAAPGLDHDEAGQDSAWHFHFKGNRNGLGYRIHEDTILTRYASCALHNHTPNVYFPPVSARALIGGAQPSAPFSVQIACENAMSDEIADVTVLGLQVSPGAWQAAQKLGLVNSAGGVQALVSDDYGRDPALARGVGIQLRSEAGQSLVFAGQTTPQLPDPVSGWYPVLPGSSALGPASVPHATLYERRFHAVLHRLPGQTVTAGRIHATAYVIVRLQ